MKRPPVLQFCRISILMLPHMSLMSNILHCKCLQGFTGCLQVSLQYLRNRSLRITKKPYTPQRERLCMLWGNPVIFTDCGENPMITIGFPRNLWILQGFPTTYIMFPFEEYRVSLWFLQTFSVDIAEKTCRHPGNPCKHLQCTYLSIKQISRDLIHNFLPVLAWGIMNIPDGPWLEEHGLRHT